jgi:hypothetical protein
VDNPIFETFKNYIFGFFEWERIIDKDKKILLGLSPEMPNKESFQPIFKQNPFNF